jgi:hypothetical protein
MNHYVTHKKKETANEASKKQTAYKLGAHIYNRFRTGTKRCRKLGLSNRRLN